MREASQVTRAVEQYGDMVRRICFLYLKNEPDVQDVFQEVFLKLMLHEEAFDSPEHEKAWLIRVAVNRCKDSLRSLFRRKAQSLEDLGDAALALPPEHSQVYDAVLALPNQYKSVIYLFYYEGYSAVEIARILGKNENTVYTWLARGRSQLKEWLGGEEFAG